MKNRKKKELKIFISIFALLLIIFIVIFFAVKQSIMPNCPDLNFADHTLIIGLQSATGPTFEILPNQEYCIPIATSAGCVSPYAGRPENPESIVSVWQFPITNSKDYVTCERYLGKVVYNSYHNFNFCDISPLTIDFSGKVWRFDYRAWEQGILPQPTEVYFRNKGNSLCLKFPKYQTGFVGTTYFYLNSTPLIKEETKQADLTGNIEVCGEWSECGYVNGELIQSRYCFTGTVPRGEARSCTDTVKITNPDNTEQEVPVITKPAADISLEEIIINNSAPVISQNKTISVPISSTQSIQLFLKYKYYILGTIIAILFIGIIMINKRNR